MNVLTTGKADHEGIADALGDASRLVVVSFCAAWCDTCNEFRLAYERLAAARPGVTFLWLDIEDDAALAGDVDVENFPTLAIYRGATPVHFGVSLPHEATVGRLIDALLRNAEALRDAPEAVRQLPAKLLEPWSER
jgi:thioredoxin reductase (NADPH)